MFQEGTSAVTFNSAFYLQQNPDVFQAIQNGSFQGSALQHFMQFGQFEGRDPNQFFDTDFYLANNTDVLTAIANPAVPSVTSAFQHFVDFGNAEGVVRAPSAAFQSFNPTTYIQQNPDLQAAFGSLTGEAQARALFDHFVTFGVNENRPGSGVDAGGVNPNPGATQVFTTNIDVLTGTAGNDTFVGDATTIGGADTVNGGAGIDTLSYFGATAATPALPTLNGVEIVNFVAPTVGLDLSVAGQTGVQTVGLVNAAQTSTFAINANQGVSYSNVTGGKAQTVTTTATDTAVTVNVANGSALGALAVNGAAVTTLNIQSTGTAANTIASLASTGTESTVNLSGSQNLTITAALDASVTKVDASTSTGGVNVSLGASNTTVTGGSGNDRFVFGANFDKADVVNGGAGFDTVAVNGANFSTAAAAAPFNALTNIERVEFIDAGAVTLDGATFTNASITNLLFNGGGLDTINNAGSARTYEFGDLNAGAAVFNMKDGQTTLNIDLLGTKAGADADVAGITVNTPNAAGTVADTGVPITLNLTSAGTLANAAAFNEANFNQTGAIDIGTGSTVNIDGSANLAIFGGAAGTLEAGFTNNVTINASAHTGNLIIQGSDFVAGGNTGVDTITLGTGTAVIVVDAASSGNLTGGSTALLVDTINNFSAGAGGDVLFFGADLAAAVPADDYTAIAAATQTNINSLGAEASLLDAANLAASDVAGAWTAFSFRGDTYALYDNVQAATGFDAAADVLVRLTGVNVADLTDANFAA